MSVFLFCIVCFSANNNALKSKRKTINVNDVFNALEDMEFDSFVDPLKSDLEGDIHLYLITLYFWSFLRVHFHRTIKFSKALLKISGDQFCLL